MPLSGRSDRRAGSGTTRLDGEAELPKARLDERLRRLLLAEETRHADELSKEGDGLVEPALDRAARIH